MDVRVFELLESNRKELYSVECTSDPNGGVWSGRSPSSLTGLFLLLFKKDFIYLRERGKENTSRAEGQREQQIPHSAH